MTNARIAMLLTAALLCAAPVIHAQTSTTSTTATSAGGKSYEVEVGAGHQWIDTKIDLRAGEKLHLTATGSVTYPAGPSSKPPARSFGPGGIARGWADLVHQYAVSDGGHGALIGRLGTGEAAQPFLVGAATDFEAPVAGRLFLGLNQSAKDAAAAQGSFHVKIEVLDPGASTPEAVAVGGPAETRIDSITPALLDEIPRRVTDPQGNPGDMVNILIVGAQEDLVKAFQSAGWVQVDRGVQETVVAGLLDSFTKKDYLTMPMSTLYLFNRPQDYGFAHAEPVRVVMSRNHLRVWKSPYTAGGQPVWCVAATHDIGFDRDQRNNGITHKIDPAIDGEREYVNDTLSSTGLVVQRGHATPANPLTEARTATGGTFHSDGRVLLLILKSAAAAR
ncbi:MAG: LssY C-terminal domain-containing protein [Acidobacteriia bacterium]|nr:LssY C-terminal domain-containing protein [Terriglobia bacterium]